MLVFNETTTTVIDTTTPATRDAVKDTGRVRYGSGAINYADATPAREATKDAGRVRFGSGAIQF
jgi:hypothetical protein